MLIKSVRGYPSILNTSVGASKKYINDEKLIAVVCVIDDDDKDDDNVVNVVIVIKFV
jgi:hypothetical protein